MSNSPGPVAYPSASMLDPLCSGPMLHIEPILASSASVLHMAPVPATLGSVPHTVPTPVTGSGVAHAALGLEWALWTPEQCTERLRQAPHVVQTLEWPGYALHAAQVLGLEHSAAPIHATCGSTLKLRYRTRGRKTGICGLDLSCRLYL